VIRCLKCERALSESEAKEQDKTTHKRPSLVQSSCRVSTYSWTQGDTWTAKPEIEIYSADEDFSTFSPSHPLGPGRGAFLIFFICHRTLLPYSLLCQLNRPSYFTFRHPSGASSRGQICASSSRLARSTYLQYHKGTLLAHHFYITSKLQQLDCLQSNSSNSCRT